MASSSGSSGEGIYQRLEHVPRQSKAPCLGQSVSKHHVYATAQVRWAGARSLMLGLVLGLEDLRPL